MQALEFCDSDAFIARSKEPSSSLNNIVRSPLFFVAVIAIVINFIFLYPLDKSVKNRVENDIHNNTEDSLVKGDTQSVEGSSIIVEDSLK